MLNMNSTKTIFERTLKGALRWNPQRREVMRDLLALLATVDGPRLDRLREKYADATRSADAAAGYKYLDVALYTLQKLLLAHELGLEGGLPRRVLDIGTGGGHFPFVDDAQPMVTDPTEQLLARTWKP